MHMHNHNTEITKQYATYACRQTDEIPTLAFFLFTRTEVQKNFQLASVVSWNKKEKGISVLCLPASPSANQLITLVNAVMRLWRVLICWPETPNFQPRPLITADSSTCMQTRDHKGSTSPATTNDH